MSREFTPGPWILEDGAVSIIKAKIPQLKNHRSPDDEIVIWKVPSDVTIYPTGQPQAMIGYEPWVQFPPKWWIEMTKANAQLIAAAPEMLEALEKIAEIVQSIPLCPEVLKIISIYEKVTLKAQGGELSE